MLVTRPAASPASGVEMDDGSSMVMECESLGKGFGRLIQRKGKREAFRLISNGQGEEDHPDRDQQQEAEDDEQPRLASEKVEERFHRVAVSGPRKVTSRVIVRPSAASSMTTVTGKRLWKTSEETDRKSGATFSSKASSRMVSRGGVATISTGASTEKWRSVGSLRLLTTRI